MEKPKRKKGAIVAIWLVAIIGVVASFCVLDPGTRKTFSPYMYSEGEGRRQYDYKYLGFLPYSKTVMMPDLKTESMVAAHLKEDGIQLPIGFEVTSLNATAVRSYYERGVSSTLNVQKVVDPKKLYSFFKAQASTLNEDTLNSDGTWQISWRSLNGKDNVRISVLCGYKTGTRIQIPNSYWLQVDVSPWLDPGQTLK